MRWVDVGNRAPVALLYTATGKFAMGEIADMEVEDVTRRPRDERRPPLPWLRARAKWNRATDRCPLAGARSDQRVAALKNLAAEGRAIARRVSGGDHNVTNVVHPAAHAQGYASIC